MIRICCGIVAGILLFAAGLPALALSAQQPGSGPNSWSYTLDTTGFKPDEYQVTATAVMQDAQTMAHFDLLDNSVTGLDVHAVNATAGSAGSGSTSQAAFGIDQIPTHTTGDRFTISGTTNLAVGDEILVEVYSASFTLTPKSRGNSFSGAAGIVRVTGASGAGAGRSEAA